MKTYTGSFEIETNKETFKFSLNEYIKEIYEKVDFDEAFYVFGEVIATNGLKLELIIRKDGIYFCDHENEVMAHCFDEEDIKNGITDEALSKKVSAYLSLAEGD